MSKWFALFILLVLLGCGKKEREDKLASKAYILDSYQDAKIEKAFYRFPILEEQILTPVSLELLNQLLADKNNFDEFGMQCFEPQFGIKIMSEESNIKNILVSLNCSRIYVYQKNKRIDLILSPIGKDKFKQLQNQLFFEKDKPVDIKK